VKQTKLYLQHTTIAPTKSSAEILQILVEAGAREILNQYDSQGRLTGLRFSLKSGPSAEAIYSLPVRTESVFQILRKQRSYSSSDAALMQQAERIAWRLLLAWTKAQLALIQVGMVNVDEVFLPYREVRDGRTFYELVQAGGRLALPSAKE
jgi:hypothetical protein